MSKYSIDIHCIAITTDIANGKFMVLSIEPDKITLPILSVTKENADSLNESVTTLMQKYLMTNQVELSPQIISLNSTQIKHTKKNHLNIVAAFLIKENIKYFDSFWIEFDYENNSEYSGLILDVIQKLR
jgi:hypothetical protein